MSLPIDIILVRHGQSEGNLVHKAERSGDSSLATPEHLDRHNSEWRLTDKGIEQAKAAGKWIAKNLGTTFDYYMTSPFIRARETAGYLNLADANWEIDPYLMERDHGDLEGMSKLQKEQAFSRNLAKRALQEFYWRPPNGETRVETGMRWDRVAQSLSQRHSDHRVIVVAHETLIEAALIRRLHWTVEQFCQWKEENVEKTKVHNCQVVHFTRRDPETGRVIPSVRWWRSVCPWDLTLSVNDWQLITKKLFSNTELLKQVTKYPRIIKG